MVQELAQRIQFNQNSQLLHSPGSTLSEGPPSLAGARSAKAPSLVGARSAKVPSLVGAHSA